MNRRSFIRNAAASTALIQAAPWCVAANQDAPGESEILGEARRRIEQHRKGHGVVRVRNASMAFRLDHYKAFTRAVLQDVGLSVRFPASLRLVENRAPHAHPAAQAGRSLLAHAG